MKLTSISLSIIGFGCLAIVLIFGLSFFGSESPNQANANAAGTFVLVVLGIPAFGFFLLMQFLALGTAIFARRGPRTQPRSNLEPLEAGVDEPLYAIAPNSRPFNSKILKVAAFICVGLAVLWSIPTGFMTFVSFVTSDWHNFAKFGVIWAGVAVPLFTLSSYCNRFAKT